MTLTTPKHEKAVEGGADEADRADNRPPPAVIIDYMRELNPVYQMLAIECLEARQGYSKFAMPMTPSLGNTFGMTHGGLIFAFADICFGFTANAARNEKGVSSSAEIHWLSPGLIGDRLIGECHEVWRKGRNALYDVTLSNERQGEVVAIVHGRMRFIGGAVMETGKQDGAP